VDEKHGQMSFLAHYPLFTRIDQINEELYIKRLSKNL